MKTRRHSEARIFQVLQEVDAGYYALLDRLHQADMPPSIFITCPVI